jgi:hypothetical protein
MQFDIRKIKFAGELDPGYEGKTSFCAFLLYDIKSSDGIVVCDAQCPQSRFVRQFYEPCRVQIAV